MQIVKNRRSSTIGDRQEALELHEANSASGDEADRMRHVINGSLIESGSLALPERCSDSFANAHSHLVSTPYGGQAVDFDDNDDNSLLSDKYENEDNLLRSDSEDSVF
eukprot:CAMPEP_0170468264 /NCGR_PEP_ID=MMETSP0123-20130129/11512_1 /TAXON_ID=182087 /ORGANISM="Favella ehrenbergii, Strain Fehren 1" /LENGTH=107 /DNA_ID=CAMNT_0010734795 /DNA_START=1157 /DNA_END=1480 /DNA_ORIENTATION=-